MIQQKVLAVFPVVVFFFFKEIFLFREHIKALHCELLSLSSCITPRQISSVVCCKICKSLFCAVSSYFEVLIYCLHPPPPFLSSSLSHIFIDLEEIWQANKCCFVKYPKPLSGGCQSFAMPLWPKGDPDNETSEQWFKALSKLQPQINILSLLSD